MCWVSCLRVYWGMEACQSTKGLRFGCLWGVSRFGIVLGVLRFGSVLGR